MDKSTAWRNLWHQQPNLPPCVAHPTQHPLSAGVLLLELDDSDGEDALLLVLGLVGSLVDHQVLSQTHVRAWQGAGHHVFNLHIVCELGLCPTNWARNLARLKEDCFRVGASSHQWRLYVPHLNTDPAHSCLSRRRCDCSELNLNSPWLLPVFEGLC